MDIVERLKQEFSGTALKDVADQIQVYVKERHEAATEIEQLRGIINDDRLEGAADKIEQLREQNRMNWDAFQKATTEIERLREQVEFERASLRDALEELRTLDKQIEWLRKELQGQALGEKE